MDAEGAFLRTEVPAENPEKGTGEDSRPGAEAGGETEEGEALPTQLKEARAQNEALERQVRHLRTQLDRAQARVSELCMGPTECPRLVSNFGLVYSG